MAESEHGILKSVELRLLRCTISLAISLFLHPSRKEHRRFLCDGASEEPWLRVLDARVDANTEYRVAVVLCLGVAALLAFLQQNVPEHVLGIAILEEIHEKDWYVMPWGCMCCPWPPLESATYCNGKLRFYL
ncbi:hypothetical protein MA16_Dca010538 [Dendrobium catenatum]|uniref:Uncharacterized protein n=1 Tax=Dendrobium catenatum TaxID=906689 RepID=A0A2I0XF12_9ASPA|nr:hypothetical protein MA16_Dca010538 [Dendrobium catenatum]